MLYEVQNTPRSDYAWRVRLPRSVVREVVAEMVDGISYTNVKDAVVAARGQAYHEPLMKCWTALLALQDQQAPRRNSGASPKRRAR